ncbi:MAG TPA: T9SS type A sorting domain-containing protein [Bacteroidia bacterium]|nr:T9SS type A sorting domain-containing protein [Bacteroidia bacterium]
MDNPQNNSGIGIGVYEHFKSANYQITDNILNLYNAVGGIEVYGANRINVYHNIISLYDDTKNLFGIALWTADENDVSCNDVYGNSMDVTNSTQIGFKISMSKGNKMQCNNASTTNTGFEFNNQCTNTEFIGNAAVYDQWMGLRVLHSGVMGVQKHHGNSWVPPFYSTGNVEAENTNTGNEYLSEFDVNSNNGSYYLPSHPIPLIGWFFPDFTSDELDCAASSVCGSASKLSSGNIDSSFDHLIATDNYHVNDFDGENGWMARKYLFEKIHQNPLLLNDPILFLFFNDELNSILPDFDEVKNKILEEASVLNANSSQLYGDHNNLDSLQKELELADSLNQIFNGTNQAILATAQAIKMQISSIVSNSKQLIENVKQSENEKSDSIQAINSGINTSETIQANEKLINEIYLATLAKGMHDFTSNQIQSILSVAHQCPYAGGKYVFLARAMYHMVNPDEEYYDNDLCTSLGYFRKMNPETRGSGFVITYPNPANETITFESFSTQGFEKLAIYSMDLNLVRSVEMNKKENKYLLSTESLPPGLYIYKCSSSNETIGFGKISIVH